MEMKLPFCGRGPFFPFFPVVRCDIMHFLVFPVHYLSLIGFMELSITRGVRYVCLQSSSITYIILPTRYVVMGFILVCHSTYACPL